MKLMSLYPQPTRTQPTVEYLPVRRTRRPSRRHLRPTDNAIGSNHRRSGRRRCLCSSVKRFFKAIFSWRGGFVALLIVLFFGRSWIVQSWRIETLRENCIRTFGEEPWQPSDSSSFPQLPRSVNCWGFGGSAILSINDFDKEFSGRSGLPTKTRSLDLILHTPGGLVLGGADRKGIKRHPAKTTVVVPHYAMSGGTLIALAANEIVTESESVSVPSIRSLATFQPRQY